MRKNRLVIFSVVFFGGTMLYFLLNPLMFDLFHYLRPRKIRDISIASNYYSIVSSFFTIFVGFLGLTLGWFYYCDRKKFDSLAKEREQKRTYLKLLLDKIDSYDRLVRRVLYKHIIDQNDLDSVRTDIAFFFDGAQSMLSQRESLLGLDEEDLSLIVKVFSFVDNEDAIMHDSLKTFPEKSFDSIRDTYADHIQSAREACYLKIV